MKKLVIHTESEEDTITIYPKGTINISNSNSLREIIQNILKKQPSTLIVDMAEVEYIDSSAIATFVETLQNIRRYSGKLLFRNVNETCMEIFSIARLDKIFTFI